MPRKQPSPDTVTVTPEPKPANKPKAQPFLTGVQEQMADILGEMLTAGSSPDNMRILVETALEHKYRDVFTSIYEGDPLNEKAERSIEHCAAREVPVWLDELAASRAARKRIPEAERYEPQTVSERIREGLRDRLERLLDKFVAGATPEEKYLLTDVMETWESSHYPVDERGFGEVPLAEAFASELGERSYVRVPRRLIKHVESYVESLANVRNLPRVN